MNTIQKEEQKKNNIILFMSTFFIFMFFTQNANAAGASENIGTMFENSQSTWVAFMNLARGIAWLSGVIISCAALFKLKYVNEGKIGIKTPLMWAFVGAALIALPGMISTATQTLSLGDNTATSLLSRDHGTSMIPGSQEAVNGVLLFIKLVGHVAFIRGFFLLKDFGSGKEGTMGRALTMIFGGAACINIEAFVGILAATFFPGTGWGI